nr:MAG TPA: hypothetical protein [Caudoviricetes sp.]
MNIDMETKVESCNYNDIEQIKILNETTKELVATILCLEGQWALKTEGPYIQHIVYKNKK